MNSLKLIITSLTVLSINAMAGTTQEPSKQYTEMKNSIYISQLEKKRSLVVHERDLRDQRREYMTFKRGLASK